MENKDNDIAISIIKGDKLFNKNIPFVINLSTPQPDENDKKSNADLICVIDISGSMFGHKINQVKESLKILVNIMDEKDRLCLILFNDTGNIYYYLQNLTKENKSLLIDKITRIKARGGTNILSGLEKAVYILKNNCNDSKNVASILLLSDGKDNLLDETGLVNGLKNLTKGLGLSFTLNTFGYGDDHDAKIMNKLANLRDGSFFYVDDYSKISEYFVTVLGGCVSVISKQLNLQLKVVNNNCQITKVYGEEKLYSHQSGPNFFNTTMLQFICGKEYTFVLEVFIDESKINIDDKILNVEINYEDITQNNKLITKKQNYLYKLKDLKYMKANEEYIRVYVYYILDETMKLKDRNETQKGKKILEDLENWLIKNYPLKNKEYLKDIQDAKGLFSEDEFERIRSNNIIRCSVQEKSFKRSGKTMSNCNSIQLNYLRSIPLSHVNAGPSYPIYTKKIPNKTFGGKIDLNFNNLVNNTNRNKNQEPKNNLNKNIFSNRLFNSINLSQVNHISSKKFK
jgi:uncharacterized protein YegL